MFPCMPEVLLRHHKVIPYSRGSVSLDLLIYNMKFVINHSLPRLPSVGVNYKDKWFRGKKPMKLTGGRQNEIALVFAQVCNSIVITNYQSTLAKQATKILATTPMDVDCFLPRHTVGSL